MKRIFKYIGLGLTGVFSIIIVFIMVSYLNHRVNLSREDSLFLASGQYVEVNGHSLHLYTEGQGESTIVFMSGGGTSSPFLDFKSLYSLLSDDYRIVVVERAGYGFSDLVDVDRDIDSILFETRQALAKAGLAGPYILMPHSMAGLEALYWAQNYPEELMAIIGLDMALPESYEDYNYNSSILKLSSLAARLGITRWIPGIAESDAIKHGTLTDEEKELYRAIFYRRTASKAMLNEVEELKANAAKVRAGGLVQTPILIFSSNGEGTGWDKDIWKAHQQAYIERLEYGDKIDLDSSHYLHDIDYEEIAARTKDFIRNLN